MYELEFVSRGQEFGTVEFIYFKEEMVYITSIMNVEMEKWTFSVSMLIGRRYM